MPSAATLRLAAVASLLVFATACSGGGSTPPAPPPPPGMATVPSDGQLFNLDSSGVVVGEPLVLKFSAGMARASVTLGGTLAGQATGRAWSTRAATDDTLTLTPATTWTEGPGATLHLTGTTSAAASLVADLTLDVGRAQLVYAGGPTAITSNQPLPFVFVGGPADPTRLVLGGTLLSAPYTVEWSTDRLTFTLRPMTAWSSTAGQTVTAQVGFVHSPALVMDITATFDVSGLSPTGLLSPAGGTLQPTGAVQATFSTTMDPATLSVTGSLAGGVGVTTWTSSIVTDDTVTLAPLTFWPAGSQTLVVSCSDLAGHPLIADLTGSFTVPVNDACGTAGGQCVNATDCAYTTAQLASWTQTCLSLNFSNLSNVSPCIHAYGPTVACSDCAGTYASCGMAHCMSGSNTSCSNPSSQACLDCLAANCTPAFATCSGRTP